MKIFDLTSIQVKECIERNPRFYEMYRCSNFITESNEVNDKKLNVEFFLMSLLRKISPFPSNARQIVKIINFTRPQSISELERLGNAYIYSTNFN
jgi:hypothetical protein